MLVTPKTILRRATTPERMCATSPSAAPRTQATPLLLEYSDFYVSEGVMRTLYQVDDGWSMEESYNLTHATKTYTVHRRRPAVGTPLAHTRLATLCLCEIPNGIDTCGTGAVTWEASIAAALRFRSDRDRPCLHGRVVELGCGVGVGGILNACLPSLGRTQNIESLTLTDGQDDVLRQCRLNVNQVVMSWPHVLPPIQVSKLDWNEHESLTTHSHTTKYHTVVACDCAYRLPDVAPLCRTALAVLHPAASSRIHLVGPHNRGALADVIRYLQDELQLHVTVQQFAADRCRLRPQRPDQGTMAWSRVELDQCVVVSHTKAHFVHIIASRRPVDTGDTRNDSISDID